MRFCPPRLTSVCRSFVHRRRSTLLRCCVALAHCFVYSAPACSARSTISPAARRSAYAQQRRPRSPPPPPWSPGQPAPAHHAQGRLTCSFAPASFENLFEVTYTKDDGSHKMVVGLVSRHRIHLRVDTLVQLQGRVHGWHDDPLEDGRRRRDLLLYASRAAGDDHRGECRRVHRSWCRTEAYSRRRRNEDVQCCCIQSDLSRASSVVFALPCTYFIDLFSALARPRAV